MYYFFLFLIIFAINLIIKKKKKFIKNKENSIILIDTFIRDSSNYINANNISIQDNYFDNLYIYLKEKKIKYNLFIKFNDLNSKPIQIISLLKKLNKHKNIFTIYDFLSFSDLIKIIKFIIFYPFSIYGIIQTLGSDYFDNLAKIDLSENLHKNTFHNYLYLLAGKNSNKLIDQNKINVISWFENLPCNLNYYFGLRAYNKNIFINGCNFLLKYNDCRWHFIDDRLSKFNIHPNKILVTGKNYLKKNSFTKYIIGSAFRYKHLNLLENKLKKVDKNILIALPYNINDWQNIIDLIDYSNLFKNHNLYLRIHPDFYKTFSNFKNKIKFPYKIDNGNLSFQYIISNSSGLTMEMAVLGTSVIILHNYNDFLMCHPMPKEGKGIIWDIVKNKEEFVIKLKKLEEVRKNDFINVIELSKYYFSEYFNSYNEININDNLNLDEY